MLLIVVWQIWASTLPAGSPAPAPLKVLQTLADLLSAGSLLSATVQSLGRVVLGFALAQRDGLLALLGYLMATASAVVLGLTAGAVSLGLHHLLERFGAA